MPLNLHGRPSVWYVDGDAECGQAVRYGLLDHAKVTTFADPSSALDELQKTVHPEVVIADLAVSNRNGLEFLRAVVKINPDIAAIAVTDLPDSDELVVRARHDSPLCWRVTSKENFFVGQNMASVVAEAAAEHGRRHLRRLRDEHGLEIQKRLSDEGATNLELGAFSRLEAVLVKHLLSHLDMRQADKFILLWAADLYDLGWRAFPDNPDRAREAAVRIFSGLAGMEKVLEAARDWREHFDGSGPQGKRAQDIPLFARIISVADFVCQAIAERRSPAGIMARVRNHSGTWFDPQVTAVFLQMQVAEEFLQMIEREQQAQKGGARERSAVVNAPPDGEPDPEDSEP
ncbi:hypothetical protein HYW17_01205 [Candidatus Uhrbacteria bacterium]|nr:hypothetical protein [Candidatus Uhrbacteria bacterium]